MSVVEQIEAQIEKLDAKTFDELRDWFMDHLHERWDQQIEADSAAGKLDFLVEEASEAEQRGATRPL
jgi:DNA mismatch repair ATPase MutS